MSTLTMADRRKLADSDYALRSKRLYPVLDEQDLLRWTLEALKLKDGPLKDEALDGLVEIGKRKKLQLPPALQTWQRHKPERDKRAAKFYGASVTFSGSPPAQRTQLEQALYDSLEGKSKEEMQLEILQLQRDIDWTKATGSMSETRRQLLEATPLGRQVLAEENLADRRAAGVATFSQSSSTMTDKQRREFLAASPLGREVLREQDTIAELHRLKRGDPVPDDLRRRLNLGPLGREALKAWEAKR